MNNVVNELFVASWRFERQLALGTVSDVRVLEIDQKSE